MEVSPQGGSAYKRWYEKEKGAFNAKRRRRYAADPAIQTVARHNSAVYRAKHPRPVTDKKHQRPANGVLTEVYRITHTSQMIGVSVVTIRSWEKKGWIPEPSVESAHRYYTIKQVKLLAELAILLKEVRYMHSIRNEMVAKKVQELKNNWE